ncbi:uncharacterized protein MELLADRAFT_52011 [Melampsora larici-populina 98AG31]|uniref:Uncharacterized protein n=1 Tax=Melampsora larici-populina (strain 98AG31 / pathotype 3-4-7) TaxID=747676 RepID=F4RDQ5_MELLP|nr:uncharacterized protein MELLADRAFT_52011 [Melampsora larici-populina 98AG31]EGG09439.1 hypothetical protein MELLADRAFT_52011 [Melampsora larici-populina 98AG31]
MTTNTWVPQPDGLSQLITCLRNSESADSQIQKTVTKQLDSFNEIPDYNSYLAYILCQLPDEHPRPRSVAGLILKNNLRRIPYKYVKSVILTSNLLSDPVPMLRGTAGTVISTIVMQFGPEAWPQAIQSLIELTEADEPLGKDGAFSTLSKICEDVPRKLEKMQINGIRVLDIMVPRFINHLKTSTDSKIRAYALICLNPFIQTGGDGSLTDNLTSYVEALFLCASDTSPDVRKNVCSALVALLSSNPDILIPNLSQTVDFMLYSTQETDEGVALEACEFWLAFGEDIRLRGHLLNYLEKVVPVLLKGMIYSETDLLMLDNDDEDEAVPDREQDIKPHVYRGGKDHPQGRTGEETEGSEDEESDVDDDDLTGDWNLRKCSAAALDVIAVNFENKLLDFLLPLLQQYLFQPQWEHKEAAILALGAIAEGCVVGMEPHLATLVPLLLTCLKDRKALVRSITCWTLGRYASWIISPGATAEHKQTLLHSVLDGNKRVQEAGCSAFATLEEEAGDELEPYLHPILTSLVMAFRKYQQKNLLILYDALGTLADSVGNALATPELLQILMPPLIERWEKLSDDDQDLIPLLECLSSIVIAIGPAFLPYAPTVFYRCVRIVTSNLEGFALYMKNPHEYELPDKTFLIWIDSRTWIISYTNTSIELINFPTPTTQQSLPPILSLLGTCLNIDFPEPSVRQSAFALVGDCAISCFHLLESYLPTVMPEIIRQIDYETPLNLTSVCNNAAWAAGEVAIKAGERMREYIEPLLTRLVPVLTSARVARSLTENSAVTIGRLALACPQLVAPHLDKFIRQWCQTLAEIKDNDEKDSAFRGMCLAIELNPNGLTESFGFWLNAVGRWSRPSADLNMKFKSLLHAFKSVIGEPGWSQTINSLSPQTGQRLQVLYQV